MVQVKYLGHFCFNLGYELGYQFVVKNSFIYNQNSAFQSV